jgi:hypothetical protein
LLSNYQFEETTLESAYDAAFRIASRKSSAVRCSGALMAGAALLCDAVLPDAVASLITT